jgi:GNAT superfamily N-acetyltransferase
LPRRNIIRLNGKRTHLAPDGRHRDRVRGCRAYRRRGYGGAIVSPLTAWLLARPEVRRVVAGTEPGNRPSYRVLEQAGFRRTGTSDTELRYAYS